MTTQAGITIDELRRMVDDMRARAEAIEKALEQIQHDYRSLKSAVIYTHDHLDRLEGRSK